MNEEARQESSVPVQTRVSIVCLAELDIYWSREGRGINSMSQLISWSLELLNEILRVNGKIESIDSVADAHKYLDDRGLYQKSLKKRSFDKISTAIRFEGMREVGEDPKENIEGRENVVRSYNMLHNVKSVKGYNGKVINPIAKEAMDVYKKLYPDK